MCGLAGFCDFSSTADLEVLQRMTDPLTHRGPDDYGGKIFEVGKATIGLGHRRLSIIDLSALGHQPMTFQHLHLVFNGEIYNYREVRKELENLGYTFTSGSDTEVILKAYHAWGIGSIKKFIGMFAMVILDDRNAELILIRDRAGVKPLFWYNRDNVILFSSELKSFYNSPFFKKDLDLDALGQYFKYGYIPAPHSAFKHTKKVNPGHFISVDLRSRKISENCYWDVLTYYNKPKLNIPFEEALEETEKILISACNYRMVSDVPVGVFLSGGYDSSTVVSLLQAHSGQTIKTFTIGFHEDAYNEAQYAKQIASHLNTDHHEFICSVDEAKAIIPDLPEMFDEPFGDSSAIPTTLVSTIAVKDVKVALSADAGDEIFAGYDSYFYFLRLYNNINRVPRALRSVLAASLPIAKFVAQPFNRLLYNFESRFDKLPGLLNSPDATHFNALLNQYFTDQEINELIKGSVKQPMQTSFNANVDSKLNDFTSLQLAIGYKTFLVDDILTKVDRATMSVSLEGREPLLDHRIIEYVAQLPTDFKFRNGKSKYLLKEIAHKYIPKPLLDRPKMGFSIPVEKWLRGDLKYLIEHYLSKERIAKEGILNPQMVENVGKAFLAGKKFNFSKVWFLLMFQMWCEKWLNNNSNRV